MVKGEFFGEAALFVDSKRGATVKAKTDVDLLVLTKDKLADILG